MVRIARSSGTSSAPTRASSATPTRSAKKASTRAVTSGRVPSSARVMGPMDDCMRAPSRAIASIAAVATEASLSRRRLTRSTDGWSTAARPRAALARTMARPSRTISSSSAASSWARQPTRSSNRSQRSSRAGGPVGPARGAIGLRSVRTTWAVLRGGLSESSLTPGPFYQPGAHHMSRSLAPTSMAVAPADRRAAPSPCWVRARARRSKRARTGSGRKRLRGV